jgi:hypothetical protein
MAHELLLSVSIDNLIQQTIHAKPLRSTPGKTKEKR